MKPSPVAPPSPQPLAAARVPLLGLAGTERWRLDEKGRRLCRRLGRDRGVGWVGTVWGVLGWLLTEDHANLVGLRFSADESRAGLRTQTSKKRAHGPVMQQAILVGLLRVQWVVILCTQDTS